MRRFAPVVPAVLCALVLAAPAHAIYGPAAGGLGANIVSVDNASDEQANAPTVEAAISANGRYVVFQTRATNFFENDSVAGGDPEPPGTLREGGIFRYDRDTRELALVADGSEVHTEGPEAGKLIFRGAQNPSISADGRYVAFSTAQQLVPQDTNENIDVYVRDMDVPLTADRQDSGAYTLVSAKSGGEEPATYTPPSPSLQAAESGRGSVARAPRSPLTGATWCSGPPNSAHRNCLSPTCPTSPPRKPHRGSCSCATSWLRRRPS